MRGKHVPFPFAVLFGSDPAAPPAPRSLARFEKGAAP